MASYISSAVPANDNIEGRKMAKLIEDQQIINLLGRLIKRDDYLKGKTKL